MNHRNPLLSGCFHKLMALIWLNHHHFVVQLPQQLQDPEAEAAQMSDHHMACFGDDTCLAQPKPATEQPIRHKAIDQSDQHRPHHHQNHSHQFGPGGGIGFHQHIHIPKTAIQHRKGEKYSICELFPNHYKNQDPQHQH